MLDKNNIPKMLNMLYSIRHDLGTIPAILAALIWLEVDDGRVLEMARAYMLAKRPDMEAPDWIRILANASSSAAINDAHDDLMIDLAEGWL